MITRKLVKKWAMFTSSGRVSVRREAGDDRDKGIAQAISEKRSIARWDLAAERKLTEGVNMSKKCKLFTFCIMEGIFAYPPIDSLFS